MFRAGAWDMRVVSINTSPESVAGDRNRLMLPASLFGTSVLTADPEVTVIKNTYILVLNCQHCIEATEIFNEMTKH